MILEVTAATLHDAKVAQEHGADRISLVTGIGEGGLTPSYGLMKKVKETIHIPIFVMIRPHNQSFQYDEEDLQTMIEDIHYAREIGIDGIEIGCLTEDKIIDEQALKRLLDAAGEMNVTFHLAFDEISDQEKALETLLSYRQIQRVMTSGADKSALNGIPHIKKLLRRMKDKDIILIGTKGLKPENLQAFLSVTPVKEIRIGSGVRVNCQYTKPLDPRSVKAAKETMNKQK